MSQRNWIILAVVALVLGIGYFFWPSSEVGTAPDAAATIEEPAEETTDEAD